MITTTFIACLFICSCTLVTVTYSTSIAKPYIYHYEISSNILNTYVRTNVTTCVFNPSNQSQEHIFHFVLPTKDAFISGYTMIIDKKKYEAEVKEKEEAQKDYNAAVDAGQSAGLVSQTNIRDTKHFTVSVNIEPLKNITCILRYEEILERQKSTYQFIINLVIGQIVPFLKITCIIEDVLPIINVQTPKFKTTDLIDENENGTSNPNVRKEFINPNKVKIVWKPNEAEQKSINATGVYGQMMILYDVDGSKNSQTVLIDEDGYMVHRIRYNSSQVLSKHVIFVLDVSGSMSGTKIEQLKQALEKCLNDLSENDYFTIVLFSEKVLIWKLDYVDPISLVDYFGQELEPINVAVKNHHIIPATKDNVAMAVDFMKTNVSTYGGTNIMAGLRHGIKAGNLAKQLFRYCQRHIEIFLFFLTDGLANVEESDPDRIIENVKILNIHKFRIFSLEFGYDADTVFLNKLALSTGAFSKRIYEASDAALQIKGIFDPVADIILCNITIIYISEVNETTFEPEYLSQGGEMIIAGKVDPNVAICGSVSAISPGGVIVIPMDPLTKRHYIIGYLEKFWAFKTVQLYLDKYTVSNNETYKKKALELALKYKFVTDLTSLIVVKPDNSSVVDDQEEGGAPEFDMGIGAKQSLVRIGAPGIGGSIGAMGSGGIAGNMAMPPLMPLLPPFPLGTTSAGSQPLPMSTPMITDMTPDIPPIVTPVPEKDYPADIEKIPITNVSWLNLTDAHNCPFIEPPKEVDENYLIAMNKGNTSYSKCADGSDCVHFKYCALNVFANDPTAYLPFKCYINPIFLGVCCPFFC